MTGRSAASARGSPTIRGLGWPPRDRGNDALQLLRLCRRSRYTTFSTISRRTPTTPCGLSSHFWLASSPPRHHAPRRRPACVPTSSAAGCEISADAHRPPAHHRPREGKRPCCGNGLAAPSPGAVWPTSCRSATRSATPRPPEHAHPAKGVPRRRAALRPHRPGGFSGTEYRAATEACS